MSAESAFAQLDDFGLIETLLWARTQGYWLAEGHRARMEGSARALGFAFAADRYETALAEACDRATSEFLRVRLELRRDGMLVPTVAAFTPDPPGRVWRTALAKPRLESDNPLLRHKTTRRALYEGALAEAQRGDPLVDEVIFLNERDEVCESARANIFLPRDGRLLTPPLACGLLAGVLRADLLARGEACEQILRLEDLDGGFRLGNALRGLLPARLHAEGGG
jgi:branched-subunit amino acid aminotransferase/4-amino-4-deoxychorismate lyase